MLFTLPLTPFFILCLALLLITFYLGVATNALKVRKGLIPSKSGFFVEGTLLSLLLSFSFAMAASKYDRRRNDITNEANNISTVLMRTRMYPDSAAREIMSDLRPYVQSRIDYFRAGEDQSKIDNSMAAGDSLAKIIFRKVSMFSRRSDYQVYTQQMVPALGNMFDSVIQREVFRKSVVPNSVMNLLLVVSLIVSFLNGYSQSRGETNWVQAGGFALLITFSFLLIMDFNSGRTGKLTLDSEEQYILKLEQEVNQVP